MATSSRQRTSPIGRDRESSGREASPTRREPSGGDPTAGEFLLRLSLRELLGRLDPEQFWQTHRATVVNLAQIARFERRLGGMEVLLKDGSTRPPVSQSFQPRFKPM